MSYKGLQLSIALLASLHCCVVFGQTVNPNIEHSAKQDIHQNTKLADIIQFASVAVEDQRIPDQKLMYKYSGNSEKPGVLFIHGTPGGWEAFEAYLANSSLQEQFFMVSIDRVGWGSSEVNFSPMSPQAKKKKNTRRSENGNGKNKNLIGDFLLQARSIVAVMNQYPDKRWLLVGHSLGASIAPKVAIIEPAKVAGLLLLAGSLNPKLGKPRWYNRIASTLLIKWMLPKNLAHSNDEIMVLSKELEELDNEIKSTKLNTRMVIIQGLKDRLVSPKNPAYALENWRHHFSDLEVIELADSGHFIPWRESKLVVETIQNFNR